MTPTFNWVGRERNDGGIDVWKLFVNRHLRYSITYLGRAGRGCMGPMRWKVQDHINEEAANAVPEFSNLDEAKAWVETVVRLET
jgi:hypothetical protein